jgi:hypothetical protein
MATDVPPGNRPLHRAVRADASSTQNAADAEVRDEFVLDQQARITELFGAVDYDPTYDYEEQRRRR